MISLIIYIIYYINYIVIIILCILTRILQVDYRYQHHFLETKLPIINI